jgi:hypothetical protein
MIRSSVWSLSFSFLCKLYAHVIRAVRVTCLVHLVRLDFITLMLFDAEYR